MSLGSDNHSGVHPRMMQALIDANQGHAHSYGQDTLSLDTVKEFQRVFGEDIEVYYVFNGTAANVLSLAASTESYNSVICTDCSHLNVDECGAPEKIAGCKLLALKNKEGKLSAKQILSTLTRLGDQHCSQPRLVSVSQPTELGTCYTLQELASIGDVCRENNLYFHVDGARFFSAVERLNHSAQELTRSVGVDLLSLSGTKNGFLYGEAVIFLNRDLARNFKYIRKQNLQLPSKTRFIATQFQRYLQDDFFREIARTQLDLAQDLAQEIAGIVEIAYPVESNAVFALIPKAWLKELRKTSFFYVWEADYQPGFHLCRLMTTFDTTSEEIQIFTEKLKEMKAAAPSS